MDPFHTRLLTERTKTGASQVAVAKAIGISWRAYQRYEKGERIPTVPILVALCDYFGVTADYLLGRSDKP